ncbi:Acyl carrier protein [Halomicronema hongdechloris C2206]|uniref:Acyl carrier protein n=1 Tax=Halomicronema hongdechloris C2206 TaxID=1641165 RepID=A0A1Z3HS63_9CYAN|nr:acyl carrier protein [Halomicronema hongdechloris]ASC73151.1 Acyl carrier protein [Halomicronema hongdechloris C2206]
MTSNTTTQRIHAVIQSILPYAHPENLKEDSNLFEMGLDSINAMTLIFSLQTEFNLQFEATEITLENFKTVGNIMHLLCQKQGVPVDA